MTDWIEFVTEEVPDLTLEVKENVHFWGEEKIIDGSFIYFGGKKVGVVVDPSSKENLSLVDLSSSGSYWGMSLNLDGLSTFEIKSLFSEIYRLSKSSRLWKVGCDSASRSGFKVLDGDLNQLKNRLSGYLGEPLH